MKFSLLSTILVITLLCVSSFTISSIYKSKPHNLSYKEIIKEPRFDNLRMIGKVQQFGVTGSSKKERLQGKLLRSLRFQNITRKVEKKYGLPKNIILAMIMHETGGADLLPNGLDDGGLGLCHMQPSVANEFGLKIHNNSKKLKDKALGRKLRKLIKSHKYDRKKLIKYDDRFHPIINIDAVGRMLAEYQYPKIKGLNGEFQSSIYRYSGKYNFRVYWKNVNYYMRKLNDPLVIGQVEQEFNRRNKSLKVNGNSSNFWGYVNTHQEQNINYGLDEYK